MVWRAARSDENGGPRVEVEPADGAVRITLFTPSGKCVYTVTPAGGADLVIARQSRPEEIRVEPQSSNSIIVGPR
jgi:hypothetical protein